MAERQPEPDSDGQPDDPEPAEGSVGATRGVGGADDPQDAGGGPRSEGSTEYAANAETEDDTPPGDGQR